MSDSGFSFIIPAFNAQSSIGGTLQAIYIAISNSSIKEFEIIIVNDGSTDGTDLTVKKMGLQDVKIINQLNQGRLQARLNGIYAAKHQNLIFLDSRVWTDHYAVVNLETILLKSQPKMVISKIIFSSTNLLGIFWDAVTRIVWRKYYRDNEDIVLTLKNFDYYPKGTTLLYVKKEIMLEAYGRLTKEQLENKNTNDDTLIIKSIVEKYEVLLAKNFVGYYFPREKFKPFLGHAKHRGYVASEGYFAIGTSGRRWLISISLIIMALVIISFRFSEIKMAMLLVTVAIELYFFNLISFRHWLSLNVYTVPFLLSYFLGFFQYKLDQCKLRSPSP